MHEPHLAPEDIDFLLDGDEGFGLLPLRKHVAACDECRARLDDARSVIVALERLPHAAPSPGFANAVMTRVNVFEPWYVSLADSVRRLVPRAGPVRTLVTTGAALAAISVSSIAIWIAMQLDVAIYAAQLGWNRLQSAVAASLGGFVSDMFGEPALDAIRTGNIATIAIGAAAFIGVLGVATLSVRGLVSVARRRGN
jgi:hypothetical protein